jgi:hypothetical protein
LIGKDHLFKRSIMLIKSWCYYESRILGAHHGLISTYALETLILYIFHLFHKTMDSPLAVNTSFVFDSSYPDLVMIEIAARKLESFSLFLFLSFIPCRFYTVFWITIVNLTGIIRVSVYTDPYLLHYYLK